MPVNLLSQAVRVPGVFQRHHWRLHLSGNRQLRGAGGTPPHVARGRSWARLHVILSIQRSSSESVHGTGPLHQCAQCLAAYNPLSHATVWTSRKDWMDFERKDLYHIEWITRSMDHTPKTTFLTHRMLRTKRSNWEVSCSWYHTISFTNSFK